MAAPHAADGSGRDIFQAIGAWLDWLGAQGHSPQTVRSYGDSVLRAGRIVRKDPRRFTEADVISALASYGPNPRGPARGLMLRALRSFYAWGTDLDVGEVVMDPARRLKVPRPKLTRAPSLEREQLAAVLKAAESVDPRARPALTLAYYTGARAGSLAALLSSDVRLEQGITVVYFREAKWDRPYSVPLVAPEAIQAIEDLRRLSGWVPKRGIRRDTLIGVGRTRLGEWAGRPVNGPG